MAHIMFQDFIPNSILTKLWAYSFNIIKYDLKLRPELAKYFELTTLTSLYLLYTNQKLALDLVHVLGLGGS
jgi:hypothetical protein